MTIRNENRTTKANLPGAGSSSSAAAEQSRYFYEDAVAFGVKLSVQESREVPEHCHQNVQISIPLGETVVDARWWTSKGKARRSYARQGQVLIVPPDQRHAVSWNNRAYFVNLHIGVNNHCPHGRAFLRNIEVLGDTHVVEDAFLSTLGENIVVAARRVKQLDLALLQALRLVVEAHITRTYGPAAVAGKTGDGFVGLEKRRKALSQGRLSGKTMAQRPRSGTPSPGLGAKGLGTKGLGAPRLGLAPWQLQKVIKAVDDDLSKDLAVADMAALLDLSKGYFSRAFRISTQHSPRQWIIRRRIEAAQAMLRQTDDLIVTIAQACGFSEQSHFSRCFRQMTGVNPNQWRRVNKP